MFREDSPRPEQELDAVEALPPGHPERADPANMVQYLARQIPLAVTLYRRENPALAATMPQQKLEEAAMMRWTETPLARRYEQEVFRRDEAGLPWPSSLEDLGWSAGEGEAAQRAA